MLQEMISEVCTELEMSMPKLNDKKAYGFQIRKDVEVEIRDLQPGASFNARIAVCPNKRREDLFILLMKANYLGQSTGLARIGMSSDEKYLTLSSGFPYELTYRAFRESLEDFVNFLLYWREEIAKFETQNTVI